MTTDEAAAVFRVTAQAIREWVKEGKFPNHIRPGRKYLIHKDDIKALLNEAHGA